MVEIKKILITIGIVLAVVAAVFFYMFIYPWVALWLGLTLMPKPPKPTICYGEFPFTLIYELNGEEKTIQDVAVCEFDGYYERTEGGDSRKWSTYLKSEMDDSSSVEKGEHVTDVEQILLLDLKNANVVDAVGNKILEFYFYGGNGHYYMGDELGRRARPPQNFKRVYYRYQNENGEIRHGGVNADEALEKYHIRLISWESAPPIENSFKSTSQKLLDKVFSGFKDIKLSR